MKETKYKIVFIDIDGVLRNFVAKMKEIFLRDFPHEHIIREDRYDLREWTSIKDRIFPWVTDTDSARIIFTEAPEHPRSMIVFLSWLNRSDGGFPKFFIVTHQIGLRVEWTRFWLKQRSIWGKIPVFYTFDKPGIMKFIIEQQNVITETMIEPRHCILLDDNIKELQGAEAIGIDTLCIDRTWNQEWPGPKIKHLGEFDPFEGY